MSFIVVAPSTAGRLSFLPVEKSSGRISRETNPTLMESLNAEPASLFQQAAICSRITTFAP
jgi:hypothetical protein